MMPDHLCFEAAKKSGITFDWDKDATISHPLTVGVNAIETAGYYILRLRSEPGKRPKIVNYRIQFCPFCGEKL